MESIHEERRLKLNIQFKYGLFQRSSPADQCIMNVQIKVIMTYSLTQRDTSKYSYNRVKTNRRALAVI